MDKERPYIEIRLVGTESSEPTPSDIGLFLNDVDTLYELLRLALDPFYDAFEFSRFVLYRGRRPLKKEDKQYLEKLRHESPIEVETAITIGVASVAAISTFVTMLTLLYNQPLNREKLRADLEAARLNAENAKLEQRKKELEIRKLQRDERIAQLEDSKILIGSGVSNELSLRDASEFVRKIERRLEKSPIRIKTIEAKVVDPIKDKENKKEFRRWLEGDDG